MESAQTLTRRGRVVLLAMVCAIALVAAACGSGSSSSGGGTTQDTGASSNITLATEGTPKPGGTLRMGLEGETNGFNPTADRWAISGTEVGLAIFDPLAAIDADFKVQPYLAEKFTPSSDYKTWTIQLRPNITFQDG